MCLSGGGLLAAATWLEWIVQPASWLVILQVAGGLGFVIFVHELGHFLVAKACGVKCEKFYLGFDVGGLKLLHFKWGETEYGIGALPLGGYVKMLGQDDNPAAAAAEAERARATAGPGHPFSAGDLPPEPQAGPHPAWDPRSYPAQSVFERMAIISAGVVMNVIFAFLMASLAYGLGVREMTCALSGVRAGGAAWKAGLRTGDEVVAIDGRRNPIFDDLRHGVAVADVGRGIEFTIRRPGDDQTRTIRLKPDLDQGAPTIGVVGPSSVTLTEDFGKGLAGAAGRAEPPLEPGDTIRTVDGADVDTFADLFAMLSARASRPVVLGVDRGATGAARRRLEITLPPQRRLMTGLEMAAGPVRAVQEGSPAAAAGLEPGDIVRAIDGGPVGDPLTLDDRLAARAGEQVVLTVGHEGAADREVAVVPRAVTWQDDPTSGIGCPVAVSSLGLALTVPAEIAAVAPGSPAARAGLAPGERITLATFLVPGEDEAGEGAPLTAGEPNWPAVNAVLQLCRAGTKLRLDAENASGEKRVVELTPAEAPDLFVATRGLVFKPVYAIVKAASLGEAFRRGGRKTLENLTLVYSFLGKLWDRKISPRLLGGPIEIAKQAGRSAQEGFGRLLLFLTMLSANLAVVNFLPIPVLDGGHMVFLLYELVRGKPPSEHVVAILSYIGLALILTLMMFVFGLDLGLIPRR